MQIIRREIISTKQLLHLRVTEIAVGWCLLVIAESTAMKSRQYGCEAWTEKGQQPETY